MGTVETFDHTADVGLHIEAETLDDLFETAARGMFDYVVANRADVRPSETETIALSAETPADLLVTWLNELIYRSETRHFVYSKFFVRVAGDGRSLEAEVGGESIDRVRHVMDHEVKAVTQHGLSLVGADGEWIAEVILDI